ncbi:hypothetical protein ACFL5X_01720 [Candidatus Omnitrophota bacterium]
MGGIGFVVLGILCSLYGWGKLPLKKDPAKSKEWEKWSAKYGKFLKIAGPILILIGIINMVT